MRRRRLIGDQTGNELPDERSAYRPAPQRPHRDADHQPLRRLTQRRGGDALVGEPLDQTAARVERPAGDLADRAGAPQRFVLFLG